MYYGEEGILFDFRDAVLLENVSIAWMVVWGQEGYGQTVKK